MHICICRATHFVVCCIIVCCTVHLPSATRQSELSIESDLAWVDSLGITGASSLGDCAVVLNETPHEETPP